MKKKNKKIIVITDGEDNKSETFINDLIRNGIVVDTVLVSLNDVSSAYASILRILLEGIQIFEQEAFLNLKIRHMNPLP